MNLYELTEARLSALHNTVLDKGMEYCAEQLAKAGSVNQTCRLAIDAGWNTYLVKAQHEGDPEEAFLSLIAHVVTSSPDKFNQDTAWSWKPHRS